jgi:CHAT domain-containing protein/tetratricopeptide (TPR) repeat protein
MSVKPQRSFKRTLLPLVAASLLGAPAAAFAQSTAKSPARAAVDSFGAPPELRAPTSDEQDEIDRIWRSISYFRLNGGGANALDALPKLLSLLNQTYGPRHSITLSMMAIRAESLASTSQFEAAERAYAEIVVSLAARVGAEAAAVVDVQIGRASNLVSWGRFDEAEPLLARFSGVIPKLSDQNGERLARYQATLAFLRGSQGRYAEGEKAAREALRLREASPEPDLNLVASTRARLAMLLIAQARYSEAERLFVGVHAASAASVGAARLLSAHGDLLSALGRYTEAEAAYLKAAGMFVERAGYLSPEAMIASAKWRETVQQTRELPAGWFVETKLPSMPGVRCKSPAASLAEAWEMRIEANHSSPDDAAACRRLILGFYEEHAGPQSPETAHAAHALALALNQLGSTDEAELQVRRALAVRTAALGAEHPDTLQSYRVLGAVFLAQGRQDEALAIAMQLAGKPGPFMAAGLAQQATLLDARGKFADSEAIWEAAVKSAQERPQDLPLLLEVLAGFFFNQTMLGKCPPELHDALQGLREKKRGANPTDSLVFGDDAIEEAWAQSLACRGEAAEAARLYAGMANAQMGRVAPGYGWYRPAALIEARRSLALARNPKTVDDAVKAGQQAVFIARNRRFVQEWQDNKAIGKRRISSGDTGSDPLAIAFVAKLRADWAGIERDAAGKAPLDRHRAHQKAVGSQAIGKPTEITFAQLNVHSFGWDAFEVAQDIGLSPAARALLQAAARSSASDPQLASLIGRQQALRGRLQERERVLFNRGAPDAISLAALEAEKAQLDALAGEVQQRFPRYAELVEPSAASVRSVQNRLKPGEALLYIQPAWDDVYVFAVSGEAFVWHKVADTASELDEKVRKLRCVLDGSSCHLGESSNRPFDKALAYEIYRDVISPVEVAIGTSTRLYVVASGSLGGLPLALLPSANPGGPAEETTWLADRYAFITLPSVSSLRAFDQGAKAAERTDFFGIGDPVLGPAEEPAPEVAQDDKTTSRGTRGANGLVDVASLRQLPSLPHTRRELTRIAAGLDAPATSLHLGSAATERAVKNSALLRQANVVVFATHGLLPQEVDGLQEPGLVFTPPGRASAEDDGLLTASETAALSLDADWVVLSACNTASSDGSAGGESLSGLARSFLYAGARSLLASHWQVSDEATAALTSETVRVARVHPEIGRAKAFQAAMRAVRTGKTFEGEPFAGWKAEWANPWFWAPFVLIEAAD